jgi:hypothetical protein
MRYALLTLFLWGCMEAPQAPQLESPLLPPPESTIIEGPGDGQVLMNPEASFVWQGNHRFVTEFRYQLDGGGWSGWTGDRSAVFVLDEGGHIFELAGRIPPEGMDPGTEETTPDVRRFTVDAIEGPALWLKPRADLVLMRNGTGTIEIMAEDIGPIVLAHLVLQFDPQVVKINEVMVGDFWQSGEEGSIVVLGRRLGEGYEIDLSLVDASPREGSGAIVRLVFQGAGEGQTIIELMPDSELRGISDSFDIVDLPLNETYQVNISVQ